MSTSNQAPTKQTTLRFIAFNIVLSFFLLWWVWQQNQAATLPEIATSSDQKLQCVSYSPYYKNGQTPLNINTRISHAQIDHDLATLSQQFGCVRIYSVGQGLDYVPESAAKLGMKVYVGAWIGWVKKLNEKELKLAIQVANQYPDTVKALIIGNEVLLRGEQTEAAMKSYILRAKAATKVPVTYADVWEFWRKHPKLENDVDFVTVHILPYWEDQPQPIARAVNHTQNVMGVLSRTFTKPILIGETGWPSLGRQREGAKPSLVNQAAYMRGFLKVANQEHWNYNLIEAFDQPWKRGQEGTAGGYWGIYDVNMMPKFSFVGQVSERSDGLFMISAVLLGGLLFVVWSFIIRIRNPHHLLSMALLGSLVGISTKLQLEYLVTACRTPQELLALGGIAITGLISLLSFPAYLFQANQTAKNIILLSRTIFLLASLVASYLLSVDGRYRDFAITLYALPILQLSLGLSIFKQDIRPYFFAYRYLGILLVAASTFCLIREPSNLLALAWLGLSILIAWANWPLKANGTAPSTPL
ncbi:hypothetical protein [Candidatus Methylopumilus turicensis]|uniref:Endo-1,3-beta-glucanase btgC n=1 Tax=Candidatus Methylopumilus turicensis TaxID=1581680 RepID=A0A0B7IUG6_9PROT|nr:hypothetical protein [Candidatus Methylopumilus turicensis]CEN55955.1 putative beta (1-6) glucan synthase [Candidatus Methylopumilus turicensis]